MESKRNWKRIVIGAAAGLALLAGVATAATVAPSIVNAQDDEGGFSFSEIQFRGQRGGPRGGTQLDKDAAVAEALGITEEALETAQDAARAAGLAQAVEEGLITQEQADELAEGNGFGRGFGRIADSVDRKALLADALGVTDEQLEAAYTKAGEIAITNALAEGLITQAQADDLMVQHMVRVAVYEAREAALEAAVEQGLITQAQADQMEDQGGKGFREGGKGRGGRRGGFERGGFDGRGGQDGRGGRGFGPNSEDGGAQFSPAPSVPDSNL